MEKEINEINWEEIMNKLSSYDGVARFLYIKNSEQILIQISRSSCLS